MHLSKRQAKIGNQIPSRGEMHGEESVTAIDIPLTDVMLDEYELGAVLREPRAASALFDDSGGAKLPFLPQLKPLMLADKIEGATVIITHGVGAEELTLTNVRIAKVKLAPCVGGMTSMDCTVQCTPELTDKVAHLLGCLNRVVQIEIEASEHDAQADLLSEQREDLPRRRRVN